MKKYIFILLTLSPMVWGASSTDYEDPTPVRTVDASRHEDPTHVMPSSGSLLPDHDPTSTGAVGHSVIAATPSMAPVGFTNDRIDSIFSAACFKGDTLTVSQALLVGIGTTPYGLEILRSCVHNIILGKDGIAKKLVLDVLDQLKETLSILHWEKAGLRAAEIERISTLTNLQELNLKSNALGPDDIRSLRLSNIPHLRLSNNNLGDEGARIIAAISPVTIKTLSLENNNIGPAGIRAIVEKLSNLQSLCVANNQTGDEEVALIASRLLELTSFSASNVSDASVDGLLSLNLKRLDLPNNTLSPQGKAALREKFPHAKLRLD